MAELRKAKRSIAKQSECIVKHTKAKHSRALLSIATEAKTQQNTARHSQAKHRQSLQSIAKHSKVKESKA